jgi:uncharacterized protein (TIGR02271 family)
MTPNGSYDAWIGRTAHDQNNNKIGKIEAVYYDTVTGSPEWLAIKTGIFGSNVTFAPIAGTTVFGDDFQLPYTTDFVKDAPNVEPDGYLTEDETQSLFDYYDLDYAGANRMSIYGERDRPDVGYDYSAGDVDTEAEMVRSEEQLTVGTAQQTETGRVRLRKYTVTEQQSVTVPVTREEVRVEREPITDRTPGTDAGFGEDAETEMILHEERPVVGKETVAKERVRLEKDTVTDTETVSGEVRKEQIEVDEDHA